MRKFFTLITLMLCAFSVKAQEQEQEIVDITANFTYCWNQSESMTLNDDNSITFNSVSWGGLASWVGGADWSGYEKIVFEYAEPTTVNTQVLVQLADDSNVSAWGNTGITELVCPFDGNDMSAVNQVALQTSDATTIIIKRIYLVVKSGGGEQDPIDPTADQTKDLLPGFISLWNNEETLTTNEDGSKEYTSVAWGGMASWFGGVDWSQWDALVMEFAEATAVTTQIKIDDYEWPAEAGVTSITADFGEHDMSNVMQVALQTAEPTKLTITKAYLIKYGIQNVTLFFDPTKTELNCTVSEGMGENEMTIDYSFTFFESGEDPYYVMENPINYMIMNYFNTAVDDGTPSLVELQGWCYPADSEKSDDNMMRFPLTESENGIWTYDFNSMEVISMLNSEKHHDWILELCVVGTDENGNEFTLNNNGPNYKIRFSVNNTHATMKGDVNEDKRVDISDIVAIINQMAGTANFAFADVNEDDKVDISDVVAVINIIAGTNQE